MSEEWNGATSTIKLYKRCSIIPEKHFIVEDIEQYLATLTKVEVSKFQYQKHSLIHEMKFNLSQVWQEYDDNDYNYLSCKNSDSDKIVYYFIKKRQVRANQTILFELEMDVLNTFKWNVDYSVNERTCVHREHKDRWTSVKADGYRHPIIDFYSEGIQTPTYLKTAYKLEERGLANNHWYLIYKNRENPTENNPTPIDCYLCPKESVNVIAKGNAVLTPALVQTDYYIFCSDYNDNDTYVSWNDGANFIATSKTLYDSENGSYDVVIVYTSGGSLKVKKQRITLTNGDLYWGSVLFDEVAGDEVYIELAGNPSSSIRFRLDEEWPLSDIDDVLINNSTLNQSDTEYSLNVLDDIDRTDILLNKIIALPYFPNTFTIVGGAIKCGDEWQFDNNTKMLKLKSLSTKFICDIESKTSDPVREIIQGRSGSFTDGIRNDDFEPKIYHSDYYIYKFIYDSFAYQFKLETFNYDNITNMPSRFTFTFVMTNTMNSKFLFKFNYNLNYLQEDYPQILPVSRNNEVVIYNSPYLNYLRTSYNYDVKAKHRSEFTTILGAGLGIGGNVAGIGLGVASGNPAVAVSGLLSGGTGIVSSLVNSIVNISQAEENFARKLDEMRVAGVSVAGADDLDLLEYYCDNKAELMIYSVSDRIKELLLDLFYFTGYNTNEFKIPNIQTRRQFNFLQCDLKLNHYSTELGIGRGGKYIPDECLDEIVNQFSIGVTFIHHYDNTWDLTQTSTNLERSTLS